MKKLLALLLALAMVLSMVACGAKTETPAETPSEPQKTEENKTEENKTDDTATEGQTSADPAVITNPDDIADEMTSADGKYQVAFITDVGQLKDKALTRAPTTALSCSLMPTVSPTSTISPPTATRLLTTTVSTP